MNKKRKRTEEEKQVETIFQNLFQPQKTLGADSEEGIEDEPSSADAGAGRNHADKETLPKESLPKESLPKETCSKVNLLQRGNYTVVDNHILDCAMKQLKPNQFVVYLYLYRKTYGWKNGTNEVSIASSAMQEDLNMSHVTIGKHIAALEEEGLLAITKEKNRNRSRTYRVMLPSQVEGFLPKDRLGKETLHKGFHSMTERNFRLTAKESLGKDSFAKGSEPLPLQDPSESEADPKDSSKDKKKDNNKAKLLLSSEFINLPEPIVYRLVEQTEYDGLKMWLRFIEDQKESIENPSGFLRCAIEQGWEVPSNWEDGYQRKRDMERQAQKEEARIAKEQAAWERWLEDVSEETQRQAEAYARKQLEQAPFTPASDTVKENMREGFKKEFLRSRYEASSTAND